MKHLIQFYQKYISPFLDPDADFNQLAHNMLWNHWNVLDFSEDRLFFWLDL